MSSTQGTVLGFAIGVAIVIGEFVYLQAGGF